MSSADPTPELLSPPRTVPTSLLPPSLSRATSTSALSVISVEATSSQTPPRKLLTRPNTPLDYGRSSRSAAAHDDSARQLDSSASSSRTGSIAAGIGEASTLDTGTAATPSPACLSASSTTPSTPSRKGKEKATLPDVDELGVQVQGEVVAPHEEAAGRLKALVLDESGLVNSTRRSSKVSDLSTEPPDRALQDHPRITRQYFVLTDAGKPVFQSHPDLNDHSATDLMGVAQTLISIFADEHDRIRSITRGRCRIVFALRAPLYLFCVSDWGEPEHVLKIHLDYIYLQILSVISSTQLSKAFQRRSNFDLSRLLEGTEHFLHHLIKRSQYDFSYLTGALQPLRMSPVLREAAAASLIPPAKFKDLLYVLLIAEGHIVTLLRPKKHSVHPSDLHLLLNMLECSNDLRSTETWIPICFPRFNPAGFVHAYISYVSPSLGLVFVSADRDAFEDLRAWRAAVVQNLDKERTLQKIEQSIPQHSYTVTSLSLGCPGLIHFVYKSRQLVQLTLPDWPAPYDVDGRDKRRLITLYHRLNDGVHARSGQSGPLKLLYIKGEQEAGLAWITRPFELYLALDAQTTKSAAVSAANAVIKWTSSEEARIFLKDAPVF